MSLLETRRHQLFPVLDAVQIGDGEALRKRPCKRFRARRGPIRRGSARRPGLARAQRLD